MPNRRMSLLNTAEYTPAVFTPSEYKPIAKDYSILERSFARQEARQKESYEKVTALDAALSEVEKNLYNDPAINEWWANYKNKIKDNINIASRFGDYASAINYATQAAGELANDTAVLGRLEASKNYNTWINTLAKKREEGYIFADTEEYFKKHTPFAYNDIIDDNGNIQKGNTFQNLQIPVKDEDIVDITYKAFKLITPTKPEGNNYKTIKSDGTGNSETLEYIDENDIINNLNEIFSLNDNYRAALWQRYLVQKDKFDELESYVLDELNKSNSDYNDKLYQYKQQKQIMGKNRGTVDFEHFVARTIGYTAISNNLAYRYKTTQNDYETTRTRNTSYQGDMSTPDDVTTTGGSSEPEEQNNKPKNVRRL